MRKTIFFLSFLAVISPAFSDGVDTKSDSLRKDAFLVFMETMIIKPVTYIRKEIPYINYVRDIRDASVYILHQTKDRCRRD